MLDYKRIFQTYDWFNDDTKVFASPGRINIIGEHTDYNDGFVLPAAIDKGVCLALSPRHDEEIHLFAHDFDASFATTVESIKPLPDSHWANYLLGSVMQLKGSGCSLTGFNAALVSDLPVGAGLSSSAAVECATVFGLNHIFQLYQGKLAMVKMAQQAEHEFVGVKCGIMDMFASMMGKKDHAIKLDCRNLHYDYFPLQLIDYSLVLFDTHVKHSLASSAYNKRREECETAVEMVAAHEEGINSLRDVNAAMLDAYVQPTQPLIAKRAMYVVEEIQRVELACEKMLSGDFYGLGALMNATHKGLQHDYEVSCAELDWLVDAVSNNPNVLGSRMMGGGFGGCTINIVANNAIDELVNSLKPAYEQAHNLTMSHYVVTTGNGTHLV